MMEESENVEMASTAEKQNRVHYDCTKTAWKNSELHYLSIGVFKSGRAVL